MSLVRQEKPGRSRHLNGNFPDGRGQPASRRLDTTLPATEFLPSRQGQGATGRSLLTCPPSCRRIPADPGSRKAPPGAARLRSLFSGVPTMVSTKSGPADTGARSVPYTARSASDPSDPMDTRMRFRLQAPREVCLNRSMPHFLVLLSVAAHRHPSGHFPERYGGKRGARLRGLAGHRAAAVAEEGRRSAA